MKVIIQPLSFPLFLRIVVYGMMIGIGIGFYKKFDLSSMKELERSKQYYEDLLHKRHR